MSNLNKLAVTKVSTSTLKKKKLLQYIKFLKFKSSNANCADHLHAHGRCAQLFLSQMNLSKNFRNVTGDIREIAYESTKLYNYR